MPINHNAEVYYELIDLNNSEISEPATTVKFSNDDLEKMIAENSKPDLPIFPSHSQSVERAVKLVSDASMCVYGCQRRHEHICGKITSKLSKLRKSFASKSYYEESYEDIF